MAGKVIELTDATFDEIVHGSELPVLVDFWAPWCGPCKMMAPVLEEIADEYAGRAKICKLNTDDARDSAMEFGISAIPTTILFKDGQVQTKWVGLTSKKELARAIDQLLVESRQ
jgi:thioredoxin 1